MAVAVSEPEKSGKIVAIAGNRAAFALDTGVHRYLAAEIEVEMPQFGKVLSGVSRA